MTEADIIRKGFDTRPIDMQPMWQIMFQAPDEDIDRIFEAIYAVHSYYEPVITVTEVLRSQCKGLDDNDNPHRWWNKGGDWKTE